MKENERKKSNKTIRVTSLFDGAATGRVALTRIGFTIESYKSSEIDKNCLAVQNHNYSKEIQDGTFVQLGDVCGVSVEDVLDTDLLLVSSPCTSLSAINPHTPMLGLDGPESSLFFEAIRLLKAIKEANPSKEIYFIFENVASMSNVNRDRMTTALAELYPNVQLLKYDSATVTASHRRRYYWTNIPNQSPLVPTGIRLSDVIENGYVDREKANVLLGGNVTLTNGIQRFYTRNLGNIVFKEKWFCDLPVEQKLLVYPKILAEVGYNGRSQKNADPLAFANGCYRVLSPLECERCLGFDDGYISSAPISKTEKIKMVGLSYSPDVIGHIAKPLLNLL
jgi:DNA (cytosine-5)-methyltransferase 3A